MIILQPGSNFPRYIVHQKVKKTETSGEGFSFGKKENVIIPVEELNPKDQYGGL